MLFTLKPLPDHSYHNKSDAELEYIIKDSYEAAKFMQDLDVDTEEMYLDQVYDAATIVAYRSRNRVFGFK